MAQTKFDKQAEETAESLMFGIGRFLAGRPVDGVKLSPPPNGYGPTRIPRSLHWSRPGTPRPRPQPSGLPPTSR